MSLYDPVSFRSGWTAPNRLVLAPLTNGQSNEDGSLGDDELRWLERRAEGGFGTVMTCAAHVSADGKGFDGQLGVYADEHLPGLTRLAQSISARGAGAVAQLYHGGARSPSRLTGLQPWSASAFTEDRPDFEVPRAATAGDIERVIGQFRDAAARCAMAGFVGVEVHGAHGYLPSQFLSAVFNQRGDGWGGDLVGRARLIREVTRAVRQAMPGGMVGVRLSVEDFGFARGLDLDESLQVAAWLAEDGADWIHLSLWDFRRNSRKRPEQHPLELFRRALPSDVRIVVAGGIWTSQEAAGLVERGADLVAVGRAAILNPDWARLAGDPAWEPRRGPLSAEELQLGAIGPAFLTYLRQFKGMVAG